MKLPILLIAILTTFSALWCRVAITTDDKIMTAVAGASTMAAIILIVMSAAELRFHWRNWKNDRLYKEARRSESVKAMLEKMNKIKFK